MVTLIPPITEKQFKYDCLHGGCLWYIRKYARPTDKIGWFYASFNCEEATSYNTKTVFELLHNDDLLPNHYFIIHPNNTYEDANGIFQTKSTLFKAWVKSCDVPWHLDIPKIYDDNMHVAISYNLNKIAIRKYYNFINNYINMKTLFNDYKQPIIYYILRSDHNDETDYHTFMSWKDDGIIPDEIMSQNLQLLNNKS